jgi:diadenosine tetraphosphate (Ap4A) HIT family hydrolase
MDINPVNPGHVLVIPNSHNRGLEDLPAETGKRMFQLAQQLAGHVRQIGVSADGVNLIMADGPAAGQTVFHVHLHVIPRFSGDGTGIRLHTSMPKHMTRDRLDALAKALGNRLAADS